MQCGEWEEGEVDYSSAWMVRRCTVYMRAVCRSVHGSGRDDTRYTEGG